MSPYAYWGLIVSVIDDILEGLRLESSVFCRMSLSGDWGFAKDALNGAPFHLVLSGQACLRTMSMPDAILLNAGDMVILPRGEPHDLLAHSRAVPIPFARVAAQLSVPHWQPGKRYKSVALPFGDAGPVTSLISGVFAFGDQRRNPLFSALPPALLTRVGGNSPISHTVASIASLLDTELLSGMPGADIVAARLADILFIQVVRHHLATADTLPRGWLRGIADGEIAPALASIHREPEKTWSVATLARTAGMSRSRFAARFQAIVGQTPLEYLTHWRMYQAAGRLANGRIALPAVASSVGYRSEVSFGKAFKRWAGRTPAQYRRSLVA